MSINFDLTEIELFKYLNDEDIEFLKPYLKKRSIPKDTQIIFEYQLADAIYILVKGDFLITLTEVDGGQRTIQEVGAGSFVGEVSLLCELPATANVITKTKCEVYILSKDFFKAMMLMYPAIGKKLSTAIITVMCQRMRATINRLQKNSFYNDKQKFYTSRHYKLAKPTQLKNKRDILHNYSENHYLQKLLSELEFSELIKIGSLLEIKKDTLLYLQNTTNTCYYFVISGVFISYITFEQYIHKFDITLPGEIISDLSCLDNKPTVTNCLTKTNCIVLKINKSHIDMLEEKNKQLFYQCHKLINVSLGKLFTKIVKIMAL